MNFSFLPLLLARNGKKKGARRRPLNHTQFLQAVLLLVGSLPTVQA
jgi:hypothetical protein